ncbi:MAG: hypothetical protein OXG35_06035 [Acidobacteria bacterium]|nr:hypothetical protein [Acidobacteriota bacterium]
MQTNLHGHAAAAAALLVAAAGAAAAAQAPSGAMVEWPYVGADQGASKYSPLADIDASNVEGLGIAWTWEPNELPNQEFRTRPGSFEVMPLMIDDVVYVSTMYTRVVALDAETGDELWAFDPEAWRTGPEGGPPGGFEHRGVAAWPATANRAAPPRSGEPPGGPPAGRGRHASGSNAHSSAPVSASGATPRVDMVAT